jgi:SAM-dependent methyltransferase
MDNHDHHPAHHAPQGHHQHGHGPADDPEAQARAETAMAGLLELDAEVLHAFHDDIASWVHDQAADLACARILDLGSGIGIGALALAHYFDKADITALDISPHMLQRLRERAGDLGLADRIHTVEADLDATWPPLDPADLAWASTSLHHMQDPGRVLATVYAALRPGGLLAVAELDAFPRFLPEDVGFGRPGLEDRCHAALAGHMAEQLPHLGADWGPYLTGAGFTIQAQRTFTIDLAPPLPAATGRYAQLALQRIRSGVDARADADDLATLDALLGDGPDGVLRRGDLTVRGARTLWIARRP